MIAPEATTTLPDPRVTSPGAAEIDSSARVPLCTLFGGAAFWILAASLLDQVASLKFHAPVFLADIPWLTYGRVHAAAAGALLYGFAVPAGLGAALWIFARQGRARVSRPWLIMVGTKLWNLGVLIGVGAILDGDSSGFMNFQMPRYAAVVLFLSYLLVALWIVLTLSRRRRRSLSASQWFLLAALFWFPWIYSTATLLLQFFPVRGIQQAVVDWWYSGNLTVVWFGLVGLAVAFYFLRIDTEAEAVLGGGYESAESAESAEAQLETVAQTPDHVSDSATTHHGDDPVARGTPSSNNNPPSGHATRLPPVSPSGPPEAGRRERLAPKDYRPLFVFWTLIVFGSWACVPSGAPVPAWMPVSSIIATVLLAIPALAVALVVWGSRAGNAVPDEAAGGATATPESFPGDRQRLAVRFIRFGVLAWLIAVAMKIAGEVPGITPFTRFTWFTAAQSQLNEYGFFAMTVFGAMYYILPRVLGQEWVWARLARWHFRCAVAGILFLAVPLAVGGVIEGIRLNRGDDFMAVTNGMLPFLRASTVGTTLILLGNLMLFGNIAGIMVRYFRVRWVPVFRAFTRETDPVEVAS